MAAASGQKAKIRKALAEKSLSHFIRAFWSSVDPAPYVHGWHIDKICEGLEAVTNGDCRRLLVNIPPRHMKSISVSVMWPAWTWGPRNQPGRQWLFASYAHPLSIRDSVKCRRVIQSRPYQEAWGDRFELVGDQNTKIRFDNNHAGYRLASSVDGVATGEGGDIIVVDDPHNVRETESDTVRQGVLDWWDEAMQSRLNDPKTGAFVIIMQRVHERDLAGHVLEEKGWTHICLPARYESDHPFVSTFDMRRDDGALLWSERFGDAELKHLADSMGSYAAAGQLQQRPAPREGGMFQAGWFEIVKASPARAKRVRYWDMAATKDVAGTDPDWTSGCLMAEQDGVFWIEDIRRMRGSPLEVESLIKQTAISDGKHVQIYMEQEPGSSGKITVDHYARRVLKGFPFRPDKVTGGKESRADPLSAAAEAGNVRMLEGEWNRKFIDEISNFPLGAHDDQVDSASGAHAKLADARPKVGIRAL